MHLATSSSSSTSIRFPLFPGSLFSGSWTHRFNLKLVFSCFGGWYLRHWHLIGLFLSLLCSNRLRFMGFPKPNWLHHCSACADPAYREFSQSCFRIRSDELRVLPDKLLPLSVSFDGSPSYGTTVVYCSPTCPFIPHLIGFGVGLCPPYTSIASCFDSVGLSVFIEELVLRPLELFGSSTLEVSPD